MDRMCTPLQGRPPGEQAPAAAAALGVASEVARADIGFGGLVLASLVPIIWFRRRPPRDDRPLARPV
jgi:hypothetical protein